MNYKTIKLLQSLFLVHAILSLSPISLAAEQDLLVFLDGRATEHIDGLEQEDDTTLAVDLVYSYNNGSFKVLGEYAYSDEENELERLQIGWQVRDNLTLWLGRVHTPDNYWNTTFHHGQYLQTSISRPWIDLFEDEGGPIASHTTGLLVEATHENANQSGFELKLTAGAGPHLEPNLEPFDIFNPESQHDLSVNGRISFLPDVSNLNQFGFVFARSSISVNEQIAGATPAGFDRVRQTVLGAYADWTLNRSRLVASIKNIDNRLSGQGSESYWGGYIYGEYRIAEAWQIYARVDHIDGEQNSKYLEILESDLADQQVLGVRWDFLSRHALTLEVAHKKLAQDDGNNIILQWSTVFP